jgi:hypothetical protein
MFICLFIHRKSDTKNGYLSDNATDGLGPHLAIALFDLDLRDRDRRGFSHCRICLLSRAVLSRNLLSTIAWSTVGSNFRGPEWVSVIERLRLT